MNKAFMNLTKFNSDSKLKKATFSFISKQLISKKERDDFLRVFNALDTDHSGTITKKEFLNGHKMFFGDALTQSEVINFFKQADLDGNGTIEFSEFVAAAMNREETLSLQRL